MSQSRARYAALLEAAVDSIVLIDRRGMIRDVNAVTLRLFGYRREELVGHNVSILMPDPYHSEHDQYLARYLREGEPRVIGIGREVVGKKKDGQVFPIDLAVGEIEDHGISGFVGFIRDLTERKAIEAQLQRREQEAALHRDKLAHAGRLGMLAELATGIAHEINQPLSAISSYAQACRRLLAAPQGDARLIEETLEKINQQAERAGKVVQGIRRLVRQQAPVNVSVDINAVLREIEPLLAINAQRLGLQLRLELDPDAGSTNGDAVQLQQVVVNLVHNGVDASHAAGRHEDIVISSEALGEDWVQIQVLDRGAGVPAELAEQVYEPFFTSKPDGIGLGLSISRTIVEAHGGEMRCQARPDGGSCFSVLLPRLGSAT